MPSIADYAEHSPYTDPGRYTALVDDLPTDPTALGAAVRNVIFHYRGDGVDLPAERHPEIDCRWVARTLEVDQSRHPFGLTEPRALEDRVAGCCRDHTLLAVSGLRQHGIPARSRVGFAGYFSPGYFHDHVVVEYWDRRWVRFDPELSPGGRDFDVNDMPQGPDAPFVTAAEVWLAARSGAVDADNYGVYPGSPYGGLAFVHDYVLRELAHREKEELLLWDEWGAMRSDAVESDAAAADLVDAVAALLVAADAGDHEAERELEERYASDDRLNPRGAVTQLSPYGYEPRRVALV